MSLQFPAEKQLEQCIATAPLLTSPYCQNKGITAALSELAIKKFAGRDLVEVCTSALSKKFYGLILIQSPGVERLEKRTYRFIRTLF